MSQEIEAKFVIDSGEDLDRLLAATMFVDRQFFLTVYYDDPMYGLYHRGGTMRLRYTQGSDIIKATLKIPRQFQDGEREAEELEFNLPWQLPPKKLCLGDLPLIREVLLDLGISELHRVGGMRSTRITLEFTPGYELKLDQILLPNDKVVNEVEVEAKNENSDAYSRTRAILEAIARNLHFSRMSKYERFVRALQDLGGKRHA